MTRKRAANNHHYGNQSVAKSRRISHAAGSVSKAVVKRAAMAMLPPKLRLAAGLAGAGYSAYKYLRGSRPAGGRGGAKYRTKGRYTGKVRNFKNARNKIAPYDRYGFSNTSEINGTISDPDCVYLGHSTMSGPRMLTVLLQAMLRKLFATCANWHCTSADQPIRGYQGFSDGWRIILVMTNKALGTEVEYIYDTLTVDSISLITGDIAGGVASGWPNLYNFFVNYTANGSNSAQAVDTPTRLCLYRREANVTNFYQFCGDILLANEVVHFSFKSEMKFQNRTLAADASADAEDVTNNPLVGRTYHFNTGAPRARVDGVQFLERIDDWTGTLLARGAEFTQVPAMKEPPAPAVFYNVEKSAKVRLEPGAIKKDVLTYTISKPLLQFLDHAGWRYSNATAGVTSQIKMRGKSSIVALEDMINVNALQLISVAYEVNRVERCYLTSKKAQMAVGKLYASIKSS